MFLSIPTVGEAQKTYRKGETGCGERDLIFSKNFQKFSTTTSQIWIFLKNVKCKGIFLSSSLDSLLPHASSDVFTGSLLSSPISSGVMADHSFCAKILACAGLKGF